MDKHTSGRGPVLIHPDTKRHNEQIWEYSQSKPLTTNKKIMQLKHVTKDVSFEDNER